MIKQLKVQYPGFQGVDYVIISVCICSVMVSKTVVCLQEQCDNCLEWSYVGMEVTYLREHPPPRFSLHPSLHEQTVLSLSMLNRLGGGT